MTRNKWIFILIIFIFFINSLLSSTTVQAKTIKQPIHKLTFSNSITMKTLFYPYRDNLNTPTLKSKGLQGVTIDPANNYYLTYATGDKNHYGYIYKYSSKGKLLKKSTKLTIGHGQAISYIDGFIYQLADIRGNNNYKLQQINSTTLKPIRSWTFPSEIHPNAIAMLDRTTVAAVSKTALGYEINKIHLTKNQNAQRDWHEKIIVNGLIGTTLNHSIQGFAFGNNQYYILSDGQYMTLNPNGLNKKIVQLKTTREPEGIAINTKGKIVIAFNKLNEIFIQN